MKKLIMALLIIILLFIIGCGDSATSQSSSSILEVKSNLDAANLQTGMIYGRDFTIDQNYMDTFVKTVELSEFKVEVDTIKYKHAQGMSAFTPYFAWICYPQITKSSQATIIFLEDVGGNAQKAGDFTVRAIDRIDTDMALAEFGSTYGTKQKGW